MMRTDLKQARIQSGYTKKQVSDMIKLSQKALTKYEKTPGKTPADVFVKLLLLYKII